MSRAKKRRPLPSVDDAIAVIRAYCRYRGWTTHYRIAKEANMHDTTLRHFNSPLWSPKVETLRVLYALIPDDFDPAKAPPDPLLEQKELGG